jgi:hypothetical protein
MRWQAARMISGTFYYTSSTSTDTAWDGSGISGATWYTTTTVSYFGGIGPIEIDRRLPKPIRRIMPPCINRQVPKYEAATSRCLPQESRRLSLRNTNRIQPFPKLKQVLARI